VIKCGCLSCFESQGKSKKSQSLQFAYVVLFIFKPVKSKGAKYSDLVLFTLAPNIFLSSVLSADNFCDSLFYFLQESELSLGNFSEI